MDYTEIPDSSKVLAADATENQVGAETNKKIAIRAEKLGDENSSAQVDDVLNKLRKVVICKGNKASAEAKNQVKGDDNNRSEKRSEMPPAQQKYRRSCEEKDNKEKTAVKIKPTLIPVECLKFTQNPVSADNVTAKYQQENDETAQIFTLMPFDSKTNPSEFAFINQYLQESRCKDPKSFINLK